VLRDKRLSAQAKIVYAGLARHALKEGLVYIGQRRLADLVNFSQSMVARKISELRTLGHITVTSDARGRRNGYKLLSTTFMPWKVERKPYKKRVSIRSQAASYYNSREILDEILESK
jgi:predicted GNAT family N-acyltransferase